MKKLFTILFFAGLLTSVTNAQSVVLDTTSVGPQYGKMMYYSLANGDVASPSLMSWDLGFNTSLEDAVVLANHGVGVIVYEISGADTSNFLTLDTTGMTSTMPLFNSDTIWRRGAFNITANVGNPFDYGWGNFILAPPYNVAGYNKLYVLQEGPPGGPYMYKKLWLQRKLGATNQMVFRIANLDNTSDITRTVSVGNYSTKNFVYYNSMLDSVMDIEPVKTAWDLVFYRYYAYIPQPYPVTGAWSNHGVQVAQANNVNFNTVWYGDYAAMYDSNATAIGHYWKTLSAGVWEIHDDTTYFVKAKDGSYWKLHFTGFGGSGTGDIMLEKSSINTSVSDLSNSNLISAGLYPNPASSDLNVVFSLKENAKVTATILDMSGKEIYNASLEGTNGLNTKKFSVDGIADGAYILKLETSGYTINLKWILSR